MIMYGFLFGLLETTESFKFLEIFLLIMIFGHFLFIKKYIIDFSYPIPLIQSNKSFLVDLRIFEDAVLYKISKKWALKNSLFIILIMVLITC